MESQKFGILLRIVIFEYESTRIAICDYSMVAWSVKKVFKKTFEEPPMEMIGKKNSPQGVFSDAVENKINIRTILSHIGPSVIS